MDLTDPHQNDLIPPSAAEATANEVRANPLILDHRTTWRERLMEGSATIGGLVVQSLPGTQEVLVTHLESGLELRCSPQAIEDLAKFVLS
ncbi:MAG: hypothetical protein COV75_06830 [Candidatus Omnitrophica bacterium CG11_big_fil_rev_8_21_14_0_20_63_9]|nr:MAG: hypothetical protein COV75_06830 [Candidatus Omnitrophica bacterium CG11_big_fil_rev_8_21_14_0_20_63_9]